VTVPFRQHILCSPEAKKNRSVPPRPSSTEASEALRGPQAREDKKAAEGARGSKHPGRLTTLLGLTIGRQGWLWASCGEGVLIGGSFPR
jgi:hypothetical protein